MQDSKVMHSLSCIIKVHARSRSFDLKVGFLHRNLDQCNRQDLLSPQQVRLTFLEDILSKSSIYLQIMKRIIDRRVKCQRQ